MLDFLGKDRPHIDQGFFPDIQESYILSNTLNFDNDFYKALVGSKLSSEEFMKIEQTILADVIREEPGSEHSR